MTLKRNGSGSRKTNWKTALDAVTSVVMIAAAVAVVWFQLSNRRASVQLQPDVPSEPVSINTAELRGSSSATTVLIVFSDFECPYCGLFARDTLPELERDYVVPGRLQLAHRYLPLDMHSHARAAAQSAECASRQGKFWPMHDRLFSVGAQLDESGLRAMATSLELDESKYTSCLTDETAKAAVSRDWEQAKALGLSSTPAFLLGSRTSDGRVRVSKAFYGAPSVQQFRSEIEAVISTSKRSRLLGLSGVSVVPSK